MTEYQLELKQIVDYPRCRIYRQFIQTLITDRSIRTNNGGSGLFYFTVLCSYANFRTSYRRLDGISYTIYPGEWICSMSEMAQWFRCRTKGRALDILLMLQEAHLVQYTVLGPPHCRSSRCPPAFSDGHSSDPARFLHPPDAGSCQKSHRSGRYVSRSESWCCISR